MVAVGIEPTYGTRTARAGARDLSCGPFTHWGYFPAFFQRVGVLTPLCIVPRQSPCPLTPGGWGQQV